MNCGSILLEIETGDKKLAAQRFPDTFVSLILQLPHFVSGKESQLVSSVQDTCCTMVLENAAYASSASPMTPVTRHLIFRLDSAIGNTFYWLN